MAGTAGVSATARELLKAGPRYQDGVSAFQSPLVLLANGASGAALAYLTLGSYGASLAPARRAFYSFMGGGAGILLPFGLAVIGPSVRKQLKQLLHTPGAGGSSAAPPMR